MSDGTLKRKPEKPAKPGKAAIDDRVSSYTYRQETLSPREYRRELYFYWICGIVFNLVGLSYMALSIHNGLSKNAAVSVNLVRVDGVRVKEAFDIRREVLMRNSLSRAQISQSIEKED